MTAVLFKSYPGTLSCQTENVFDHKKFNHKVKEIFNYAENYNIKSLSSNIQFIKNRVSETFTSPKELLSLTRKTIKAWTSKK
jgi:hypothetical protein